MRPPHAALGVPSAFAVALAFVVALALAVAFPLAGRPAHADTNATNASSASSAATAKLVEQLQDADASKRRAATGRLRRLGAPGLKALHAALQRTKDEAHLERLTEALETILDGRARKLLPKRMGAASKKAKWTLAHRFPLLPFLRCYRARGTRYPEAVILDLLAGAELARFGAEELELQLRHSGVRCRTARVARQVAELYVALHYQPYAADKVRLKVRRRGRRGHLVEGRFLRTMPWSSGPGPGAAVVRSRTVERRVKLSLSRACRFRVLGDSVSRVVYSGQ
jgi:hypothetical protein